MQAPEGFTLNGTAGNSAPVGGRRKMKKVSAKTIRRTLKKLGMKPKGRVVLKGGEGEAPATSPAPAPAAEAPAGGRRHRKTAKKSHKWF
jgi:hypothetical protein